MTKFQKLKNTMSMKLGPSFSTDIPSSGQQICTFPYGNHRFIGIVADPITGTYPVPAVFSLHHHIFL